MSAQIPETMLLKDLLKPSGYDCPEEMLDKTFAEATAGGDVQTNKAATIDVSAYTEPIVVKPDTDYESMKKTTVTLSSIPQAADLESNHAASIDVSTYTEPVEIEPTAGKDGMEKVTVTLSNIPQAGATLYAWKNNTDIVYTKVAEPTTSDKALVPASTGLAEAVIAAVAAEFASITISTDEYARYATGDITL